jgi:hypothetical protein
VVAYGRTVGTVAYYKVVGSELTDWEMACGMQAGTVRPAWAGQGKELEVAEGDRSPGELAHCLFEALECGGLDAQVAGGVVEVESCSLAGFPEALGVVVPDLRHNLGGVPGNGCAGRGKGGLDSVGTGSEQEPGEPGSRGLTIDALAPGLRCLFVHAASGRGAVLTLAGFGAVGTVPVAGTGPGAVLRQVHVPVPSAVRLDAGDGVTDALAFLRGKNARESFGGGLGFGSAGGLKAAGPGIERAFSLRFLEGHIDGLERVGTPCLHHQQDFPQCLGAGVGRRAIACPPAAP